MGTARNMCTKFWLEDMKGRDHLEDLGIDGMITLEWILRKLGGESVVWVHMAEDREQWQDLVIIVINLRAL